MTGRPVDVAAVVVPVHNEAELLDRCLTALTVAVETAARRGIRCQVQVVLDACTDASAAIAANHPFPTLVVSEATVGQARARGVQAALTAIGELPAERVWLANTDADSAVPPNWIVAQCDLAAEGADVFVGTVRPDFADLGRAHRHHWLHTHVRGAPNGHVHGASLGLRASVYRAAGGFDAIPEHEDVQLVARARALGAIVQASDEAEVLTSGRFVGRTPGGYAGYLREQARMLAAHVEPPESSAALA
ncbi:glycosyltransferase [Microbacterium sp. NPDC019599]|uniref:glycosyltransferase n=1 Tax=Microbacterium sp. NPDC019599 TaxID=3154690 RepID=UPI0033FB62B4